MPTPSKKKRHCTEACKHARHAGRPPGRTIYPPQPPDDARNQPVLQHGCVCCGVETPCVHRPRQPPRKRSCINTPIAVDPQHPPTAEEMKLAAVVELQTRQALAKDAGTRVAGATVGELAKKAGVGVRQLHRLSAQFGSRSLSRRPGSGRPVTANATDIERWFRQQSRSLNGAWTAESMAIEMRKQWGFGSSATVSRLARKLGYRQLFQCYRPALTAAHQERRLDWAKKVLEQPHPFAEPDTVYVHVDEKWFLCPTAQTAMLGRSKGETTGGHTCEQDPHHQGHVPRRSRSTKPGAQLRRSNRVVPHCRSSSSTTTEQAPQQGRPSLEAGQHGRRLVQGVHEGTCG